MDVPVLRPRELNRSLLARQGLLERLEESVGSMLERLVGLQAQVPENPYVALWSRLRAFDPLSLSELIAGRGAVRAQLMRSTIHLVTARDMLAIGPVTLPMLARTFKSPWAAKLAGAPVEEVVRLPRRRRATRLARPRRPTLSPGAPRHPCGPPSPRPARRRPRRSRPLCCATSRRSDRPR